MSAQSEIDQFKQEFKEMIEKLSALDIYKVPNMIVLHWFDEELRKRDYMYECRADIISCITIDVTEEFVKDELYGRNIVRMYVNMIQELENFLNKINPYLFRKYLNANKITLKFHA